MGIIGKILGDGIKESALNEMSISTPDNKKLSIKLLNYTMKIRSSKNVVTTPLQDPESYPFIEIVGRPVVRLEISGEYTSFAKSADPRSLPSEQDVTNDILEFTRNYYKIFENKNSSYVNIDNIFLSNIGIRQGIIESSELQPQKGTESVSYSFNIITVKQL